jgi:hypothetical protein
VITAGTAIAPAVIAAGSALAGVLVTSIVALVTVVARNRREDRYRHVEVVRASYVDLFAALDDSCDVRQSLRELDSRRVAGQVDGPQYALELPSAQAHERAVAQRLNVALATVDLLAPQAVCDLATDAYEVCDLVFDSNERVRAMEALVTSTRRHLGIEPAEWTQKV